MRRVLAITGAVALALGMLSITPAQATHCAPGPGLATCPNPVVITLFEGKGLVCTNASDFIPNAKCTYHTGTFWGATDKDLNGHGLDWYNAPDPAGGPFTNLPRTHPEVQGLYLPKLGPGADSPFYIAASGVGPPNSFCVSSVGGANCVAISTGTITKGAELGDGAYCGSSKGNGVAHFTSFGGALQTTYTFGWNQSAGSLLIGTGSVTSTTPAGGAGATVIQIATSRGVKTPDNHVGCGGQVPVTSFDTEGVAISF